jgi:hypothetical protein
MKNKMHRLQFDASKEAVKEYEHFQWLCKIRTMASFVVNALTMFVWALEEINKGKRICSYDETKDRYTIYEMPAFSEARRNASEKKIATCPEQ